MYVLMTSIGIDTSTDATPAAAPMARSHACRHISRTMHQQHSTTQYECSSKYTTENALRTFTCIIRNGTAYTVWLEHCTVDKAPGSGLQTSVFGRGEVAFSSLFANLPDPALRPPVPSAGSIVLLDSCLPQVMQLAVAGCDCPGYEDFRLQIQTITFTLVHSTYAFTAPDLALRPPICLWHRPA